MYPQPSVGKCDCAFVMRQGRDADLLEVVGALHPPGGFPRGLHGRQQQRDQDPDDRDHDQQFHERKAAHATPPPSADV